MIFIAFIRGCMARYGKMRYDRIISLFFFSVLFAFFGCFCPAYCIVKTACIIGKLATDWTMIFALTGIFDFLFSGYVAYTLKEKK